MSDSAVKIASLGKLYKLYDRPAHRLLDAFGLSSLPFVRVPPPQRFWALRDFDLEIPRGQRLGIIGRNGAGKSTLLRIIAGALTATEGQVEVNGNVRALLELGTGFHPEFTGRQNIRTYLAYQGLSAREIEAKEPEVIDFAEIDEFIDHPVKTYSAGMYARLAFSAATAVGPDILIIDEILAAGDAYFAGKCVERMKALTRESGATVLFVSHDLASVQHLCDRVVWLDRGKTRADGAPLEVVKAYSAAVRKDEEARLKARDRRVLRNHALSLGTLTDIYDRRLFHLVPGNGSLHPRAPHKIYFVRLKSTREVVAEIDVGGPLDNSPEHLHYVLDAPGYMDWGEPQRDGDGSYRLYADVSGRYAHAPFELAVPKTLGSSSLELEIVHKGQEPVKLELYNGEGYTALGVLPTGADTASFVVPALEAETNPEGDSGAQSAKQPTDFSKGSEYGNGGARITRVALFGPGVRETKVLQTAHPARILFEYAVEGEIRNPVFVFCAYLPDGRCATQFFARSGELGRESLSGRGAVAFDIDTVRLGRGAYVASAAIFKDLRHDGLEPASYHVLDRCIHFQVVQPREQPYEQGLCLQTFEAAFADE
ncbi:MAG: ABC transporter ATP-binding protein [Planctomycetes bacterium]|nr:ABC transporter ATP-binding protein [Planctomycetota bacterium]